MYIYNANAISHTFSSRESSFFMKKNLNCTPFVTNQTNTLNLLNIILKKDAKNEDQIKKKKPGKNEIKTSCVK